MAKWPFVQKTKSGLWRGWVMVGKSRRYLKSRASAQEASEEAIEWRKRARSGFSAMTLGMLAERFLDDVRCTRAFDTWAFYDNQLEGVFRAISRDMLLDLVSGADMRLLVTKHLDAGYSAQTIQHRRATLRRMFRWAKKCGGVKVDDPTVLIEWPIVTSHAFDVIERDTLRRMLELLQTVPVDYDLVLVAAYTGLRRAELARLRVEDIDLPNGVLWVRGKVRREPVTIDDAAAPSFGAMLQRAVPPFLVPESRVYRGKRKEPRRALSAEQSAQRARERTVANTFRRWAKRFKDRRFHPHALRHSLATELTREGESMQSVGDVLRHRDPQTTKKYVHLGSPDRRRALAKLRLVPKKEADHG